MKTHFDIETDISGAKFTELLLLAPNFATHFHLVVRHENDLNPSGHELIAALKPFLINVAEKSEWPGTVLPWDTAAVHYYRLEKQSAHLLEKAANSVFQWQQPELPEDLCFIREDGSPWFYSIAHESYCCFELLDSELEDLRGLLNDLDAKSVGVGDP